MLDSLEHDDRQFLTVLRRLGGGTVQELCDAAGVTATAIRQRLNRLQSLGLIEREVIREGRGRPHYTYRVTSQGLSQLGDNYSELCKLLWSELHTIEEAEVRQRVTNRIRDALVQRYGSNVDGSDLSKRFAQLGASLVDHGFSVEVLSDSLIPILRENNCPYHDLAQADSGICELEQEVFERVLGVPLTLATCCRDGHHCCEFLPANSESANGDL
jgi:predicted ArsR family transcriptional regulator